jgi:hypothetical protein
MKILPILQVFRFAPFYFDILHIYPCLKAIDKRDIMMRKTFLTGIGFLLMTGPSTTIDHFEADIFSARRIKVAPVMCLIGFVIMIYAVIKKPKEE